MRLAAAVKILESAPHFVVIDIRRSVRFDVDVPGFSEPPLCREQPVFAMPHRDGGT